MDFILASASPRRKELLGLLGLTFAVEPASIDEVVPDGLTEPASIARELARQKALEVSQRHPGQIVLAADTIVAFQGEILGKPSNPNEAWRMLDTLRNRINQVITGVAVTRDRHLQVEHALTSVQMRNYSDRQIAEYIERGNPFDKAGGYAIQDCEFRPVKAINGCNCNVIGLPLAIAVELLMAAGVDIPPAMRVPLRPECASCPLFNR